MDIGDYQYQRLSIAAWGDNILDNFHFPKTMSSN